jgi:RimJ/RimL family protein N-acetyltransferase
LKAPELLTSDENIRLIEPDVERDAPLSFEWLSGEQGRHSQRLLGVAEKDIHPPTLDREEARVESFLDREDQLVWMIEVAGDVVGAVEVNLADSEYVPAPWITIFIGDHSVRGGGIGTTVMRAVVSWLVLERSVDLIFARYRIGNETSAQMLLKLGFENDGEVYADHDGLEWQNVIYRQEER